MTELSSKRLRVTRLPDERVAACFCGQCSRLLYVPESELLFCPVCSSLVSRIEPEPEPNVHEESRATD